MGGYDLVIPITSLFYRPNNLKNFNQFGEEMRRDQPMNHNPSTDFTKSLNWIKVMLVKLAPRSVTLINLNDIGQLKSLSSVIKI